MSATTSAGPEQLTLFAEEPAPGRTARRLRRPGSRALLVVALLLLAGLTGWLLLRVQAADDRATQREAAVSAAGAEVTQLWTITSAGSDQALKRLMDGATGSFKAQLGQQSGSFQQILRQQGVSAAGSVVRAGLVSLSGKKATVLVAVDARISSPKAKAAENRQYRMQVHLRRSGDRWLVADLGFVA